MTTDLEADLRREFDAATPPSSLTFRPESILRQGNWTIRRRRIIAAGSAAMAVALVAVGATVMNRPHNTAAPPPASHKATTGIVRASLDSFPLTVEVEVNRDPRVTSNVKFVVISQGRRVVVGVASTARPGQRAEAIWKSGVVAGHPFTVGLVPGDDFEVKMAPGAYDGLISDDVVTGTGYSAFSVIYKQVGKKQGGRPSEIASISWSGPTGIVDGTEGGHRLSGQILKFDSSASEKVVLRQGEDGRTMISGEARLRTSGGHRYSTPQTVVAADALGVAVLTGRFPVQGRQRFGFGSYGQKDWEGYDGAPVAAGLLPSGATNIEVLLTAGEDKSPLVVSERLPDGRVVFAVKAESAHPSTPSKDSIKAVTWTNADGTQGRKDVTQKQS